MSKHLTLSHLQTILPPIKHLIDKKAEGVDWNENDPSAKGYVKNRPFYEAIKNETLFEGDFTFSEEPLAQIDYFEVTEGQEYVVTFNDVEYILIANNFSEEGFECNYLGNAFIGLGGNDTGEPFFIGLAPGNSALISTEQNVSITVKGETRFLKKIDPKFLPEQEKVELGQGDMIGKAGTGQNAEIFNDYTSNKASGRFSHAEGYQTKASGTYSHVEGSSTEASGSSSHAEGYYSKATRNYSHAEGQETLAEGQGSHAEGYQTKTYGQYTHAEGWLSEASDSYSHAEGAQTNAAGSASHAEGNDTSAAGTASHAEGYETIASGNYSHSEGRETIASGEGSHTEGHRTYAVGESSHAEGHFTFSYGRQSHAEGRGSTGRGIQITGGADASTYTLVSGTCEIGEIFYYGDAIREVTAINDDQITFSGTFSSEVALNRQYIYRPVGIAEGECSHTEGLFGRAIGKYSHAEGQSSNALGESSHAEGQHTEASGKASHAEGFQSTASGAYSHAEGSSSLANGSQSHAEGRIAIANGTGSHAEGYYTKAEGDYSHAEGYHTEALGNYSHAQGRYTQINGKNSFVSGEYNKIEETFYTIGVRQGNGTVPDTSVTDSVYKFDGEVQFDETTGNFIFPSYSEIHSYNLKVGDKYVEQLEYPMGYFEVSLRLENNNYIEYNFYYSISPQEQRGKYVHVVGNGTADNEADRSNAHTLDWNGNAWYQGDVFVGGTDQSSGERLAKMSDLDSISVAITTAEINTICGVTA